MRTTRKSIEERGSKATAAKKTRAHGHHDSGDEESEEEFTTEEFEVELDDTSAWAMNFYDCASEGDFAFLKQILDDGKVDVNNVDVDGFTALMIAAAEGHKEIVMELLQRGADVAVRTHELRSTALHFAAKNGDAEIVEAICKKDQRYVDCWNINADTPLIWACIEGRVESVRVLLSYNADVNVVNQYGATTLICSVMIGEDPEEDESDDARSEIIKMLLAKNPKLVNFQDREGSTAMHLAASCGYLECMKTLLAHGADITLRNAIGQTPLEEAEQTGLVESDVCVEHLRGIWQNLEEEAAARMMMMLEMEEQTARGRSSTATNSNANGGQSSSSNTKKNKKKNKKAKRKAAKQQTAVNGTSVTEAGRKSESNDAGGSSGGESSDEDEKQDVAAADANVPTQEAVSSMTDEIGTTVGEATELPEESSAVGVSGVWMTVGKKHKVTAPPVAAQEGTVASTSVAQEPADTNAPSTSASVSATSKVAPFNARRKYKARNEANGGASNREVKIAAVSRSTVNDTTGNQHARVRTHASPHRRLASSVANAGSTGQPTPPYSATLIFSSSSSSLYASAAFSSSNGTKTQERVRSHLNAAASPWRSGFGSSSSTYGSMSSGSVPDAVSSSPYAFGNRMLWKHSQRVSVNQLAVEAKDKWVSRLHLANENVSEAIGYLACGLCGELVNENLQCNATVNGSACTQLYCGMCLMKTLATTGGVSLKCVKCHQFLKQDEMKPNHFAQAQAASLGLSSSSHHMNANMQDAESYFYTMEEMKHTLETSIPQAAIVELNPFHLTPGSDLSVLSNGQLEILEQAHQLALTQIMEMRIANARAQERLQIEEWMKTQRDIMHFAAMAAATTTDSSQLDQ